MRTSVSVLLSALLFCFGCGHKQPNYSSAGFAGREPSGARTNRSSPGLIVTPDLELKGKVVRVNPGGRFIVLNFPVGRLPWMEQRLSVYRLGLKVGEVKVTGPQMDDNIVADVVGGDAAVGDEVRER